MSNLTTKPNVCPDCKNTFFQPFVCTTCGAQRLYDETVRSQQATIDRLTAELTTERIRAAESAADAQTAWMRVEELQRPQEARETLGDATWRSVAFALAETTLGGGSYAWTPEEWLRNMVDVRTPHEPEDRP